MEKLALTDSRQRGLQPSQAVAVLDERVKLIARVNNDVADFLAVGEFSHWRKSILMTITGAPKGRGSICGWTEEACAATASRCLL